MQSIAESEKENVRKIRGRIRRYERALGREYACGGIHDGYGKRYLLGPLYLLAGDLEGSLSSYEWFERMFPDDGGEPTHKLCWALALHRSGDGDGARKRLTETMFRNLYLIPALWGEKLEMLDIWHGDNMSEPEYLSFIPKEIFGLWTADEVRWARTEYEGERFRRLRERYVELSRQLNGEPAGRKRTALCKELNKLKEDGIG